MSSKTKDRINRSLEQKLYLLSANQKTTNNWIFEILGSTSSHYIIEINEKHTKCSCMDYKLRKMACKHIYFIFGKILGNISFCETISMANIRNKFNLFEIYPDFSEDMSNKLIRKCVKEIKTENQIDEELSKEMCSICYDCFGVNNLKQCNLCKNHFHEDCISVWLSKSTTCPLCRGSFSISLYKDKENENHSGLEYLKN